jgi:hypothetical protein
VSVVLSSCLFGSEVTQRADTFFFCNFINLENILHNAGKKHKINPKTRILCAGGCRLLVVVVLGEIDVR